MTLGLITVTQDAATQVGAGAMHFIAQTGEIATLVTVKGDFVAQVAVEASPDEGLTWFGYPVYNLTTGEQTVFVSAPGTFAVNHNANISHIRTPIFQHRSGAVTVMCTRASSTVSIPREIEREVVEASHMSAHTAEITGITAAGAIMVTSGRRSSLFVQNTGDVLLQVYYCLPAEIVTSKPVAVLAGGLVVNDGLGAALTDDEYTGPVSVVAPAGVGRGLVTIY